MFSEAREGVGLGELELARRLLEQLVIDPPDHMVEEATRLALAGVEAVAQTIVIDVVAGHSGTWAIDDTELVLRPYPANFGPYALEVVPGDEDGARLRSECSDAV